MYIHEFKLSKRFIKSVNQDVVSLGFPIQTIEKWLHGRRYFDLTDAIIECEAGRELHDLMLSLLEKVIYNDSTKRCWVKGSKSDWDGLPDSKSLFHARPGCGLPIGNLTSLSSYLKSTSLVSLCSLKSVSEMT